LSWHALPPALTVDHRLAACLYSAVLTDDTARMRHLLWRIVPLQCAAVSPIAVADRALRGRILNLLNVVKLVPNAATASESEAIAWLMSRPPQLSVLARAARCSVPATGADVER